MPGEIAPKRILIVASYSSVRAGLHALLAAEPGLCLLGDAPPTSPLARLLADLRPDIVVLDTVGDGTGEDSIDRLLNVLDGDSKGPGMVAAPSLARIAAVVIGDSPDRDLPRLAAAGLPGWAYVKRDAPGPRLVGAVRAAAAGLVALDTSLDLPVFADRARRSPETPVGGETLTAREIEVLALMAEGLPNKIIATRLGISLHTAKFHVAQILGKLDAASRTEAVTVGARRGYLTF